MGDPATEKPGDNAVAAAGSILGLVFKPFEYVWRAIPRSVQYFLIGAVILLVIYPLIAFAAIVHLVPSLPDRFRLPLQARALEAWGLERVYSSNSQLDQLNEAVDTSQLWKLTSDKFEDYNQSLVPRQRVLLRATVHPRAKEGSTRECVGVSIRPDAVIGEFSYSLDESDWSKSGKLRAKDGKPQTFFVLDQNEWPKIGNQKQDGMLLTISYYPADDAATSAYLKCYRYEISAYIVVYKPQLSLPPLSGAAT